MLDWIKKIFGQMGNVQDGLSDPVNTSGDVMSDIVAKLNPVMQRVIVLVLIVIAMLLGADMGIEYQQSKAVSFTSNPTVIMDCTKCLPPPETLTPKAPDDKVPFSEPLAEPMTGIEVWKPNLQSITLPGAKPENPTQPRPATKLDRGETAKSISSPSVLRKQARKRAAGTRHLQKKNRPVRSNAAREKLCTLDVYKGLPMGELSSSGIGGY